MDEPPFLLVTEYLPNGDMKNYLKKAEAKEKLPFDKLIRISENVSKISKRILNHKSFIIKNTQTKSITIFLLSLEMSLDCIGHGRTTSSWSCTS